MTSSNYSELATYWHLNQALIHLDNARSKNVLDGEDDMEVYEHLKALDQLAYDLYSEMEGVDEQ